jgi:hypothetical protein
MKPSVEQLASRAASRAMAEAAKNITPPTTAYQFEVSWRGFSGDRALQACLLKVFKSNILCIFYLTIFNFEYILHCLEQEFPYICWLLLLSGVI